MQLSSRSILYLHVPCVVHNGSLEYKPNASEKTVGACSVVATLHANPCVAPTQFCGPPHDGRSQSMSIIYLSFLCLIKTQVNMVRSVNLSRYNFCLTQFDRLVNEILQTDHLRYVTWCNRVVTTARSSAASPSANVGGSNGGAQSEAAPPMVVAPWRTASRFEYELLLMSILSCEGRAVWPTFVGRLTTTLDE